MLKKIIAADIRHFRALSESAQRILRSFAVYEFLYPLLFVFVNAFILRQTNDFLSVAIYNVGIFVALPFSFYVNGLILKKFPIELPHLIGMVGQGVVACCVFFLPINTLPTLCLFGLIQGIPMGLYWANRNFISLDVTHDENRSYFTGLEQVFSTAAAIITPLFVGWTISLADNSKLVKGEQVYKILGVLSLFFLYYGAKLLSQAHVNTPKFKKLWVGKGSQVWNDARLTEFFRGIQNSLDLFIAPLIVFTFLGKEASLGTIQSGTAIIGIVVIYSVARYLKPANRLKVLSLAVAGLILLSGIFLFNYAVVSAASYVLFVGLLSHMTWISSNPIAMRAIDLEDGGDPTNNYAFVCDRELFLNVGRVFGVACFALIMLRVNGQTALRYIPFLAACSQLGVFLLCRRMTTNMSKLKTLKNT